MSQQTKALLRTTMESRLTAKVSAYHLETIAPGIAPERVEVSGWIGTDLYRSRRDLYTHTNCGTSRRLVRATIKLVGQIMSPGG